MATVRGANGASASSTSLQVPLPASTAAGDLVLIGIIKANTTAYSCDDPSWTLEQETSNSTNARSLIAWKRLESAGETAPTFSWTTSAKVCGTSIALIPAAGKLLQVNARATVKVDTTSATTHTPNSVAAAGGATVASVVFNLGKRSVSATTGATVTPATNWTEPASGDNTSTGTSTLQCNAEVSHRLAQTGTITPGAATWSQTSFANVHHWLLEEVNAPVAADAAVSQVSTITATATIVIDAGDATVTQTSTVAADATVITAGDPARDQTSTLASVSGTSGHTDFASNPQAGSKLILFLWVGNNVSPSSVADNAGNTYVKDAELAGGPSSFNNQRIYRADGVALPGGGGLLSITVTYASSQTFSLVARSYTGVASGGPSAGGGANATSSNFSASAQTSANSGAAGGASTGLHVATMDDFGSGNPRNIATTAPFAQIAAEQNGSSFLAGAASDQVNAAAAQTCNWTHNNAAWGAIIAAYDTAGGGGGTVITADAAISNTSAVAAAATRVQDATATLAQSSSVAATALGIVQAAATISQASQIAAAATIAGAVDAGTATISQASTVTAAATRIQLAAAIIANTSAVTADGVLAGRVDADATITNSSSIAAAATQIHAAQASISQASGLVAQAIQIRQAAATIANSSALAAAATMTQLAAATITGGSQIAAGGLVVPPLPQVGSWDVAGAALATHEAGGAASGDHEAAAALAGSHEGA